MFKNFKFNLKLTAFLVSLFVALLLLILGNKNQYCLSFGLILLGASLVAFVFYATDKINNELLEIEKEIDELDEIEEPDEDVIIFKSDIKDAVVGTFIYILKLEFIYISFL